MFDRLIHAEWSTSAKKRWLCSGRKADGVWTVDAPVAVEALRRLLDDVRAEVNTGHRVLLGFDFPIGLPVAYATQIGFADCPAALSGFGQDEWQDFFDLGDAPREIGLRRPFYPRTRAEE